jgi:pimeloyl-ACP methyl ester carboxylesterase
MVMAIERKETEFSSQGTLCRAWLFHPDEAPATLPTGTPCLVMAHGLGGTRDAGLEPFARRLAEAGFAVLVFDYRHFGASEGTPRQLMSIAGQLQDWAAAIAHARSLPGIDPARIGLWGSSFSGGHVVVAAARGARVAALSAQGPMMDGLAAVFNIVAYAGLGAVLGMVARGLVDVVRSLLGMPPRMLPIVAPPGHLATMATPDAEPGYRAIVPPTWRNEVCARLALALAFYRPIAHARRVRCPALIQVCLRDSVAPPGAALKTAAMIGPLAELKQYDIGHFDIYVGAGFERASADQVAFFSRVLRPLGDQTANPGTITTLPVAAREPSALKASAAFASG